jgi:hypothetical protein
MLKFKQPERILRIVCFTFAAVLLFELVRAVMHLNPLTGVSLPAVPSLADDSDAPAKGTNSAALAQSARTESNGVAAVDSPGKGTNAAPALAAAPTGSNPVVLETPVTNAPSRPVAGEKAGTNSPAVATTESKITNSAASPAPDKAGTNLAALGDAKKDKKSSTRPDAKKTPELPPVIQARLDRIVDSEILAPVMHPMPMGLLGIAGDVAFLRAPSGQTGLVKEGDNLGGIKLLRIGINRVLVEEQGQKQELMIFSGFGGDSLLPKQETPK